MKNNKQHGVENGRSPYQRIYRHLLDSLRKHGPLRTRDIYPLVQELFPNVSDHASWEHWVRAAQEQATRRGYLHRKEDGHWIATSDEF
jgi:hypothetical protein